MENEELVLIQNNQVLTDSRIIAEKFEKSHNDILKSIRRLQDEIKGLGKKSQSSMFVETTYVNTQSKQQPMYLMNRDDFSLLVMGFTGSKALQFKLKFVEEFNRMEAALKEQRKSMTAVEVLHEMTGRMVEQEREQKRLAEEQKKLAERQDNIEGTVSQVKEDISVLSDRLNSDVQDLKFRSNREMINRVDDINSLRDEDKKIKQQISNHEEELKDIRHTLNGNVSPAERIQILISDIVKMSADSKEPLTYSQVYNAYYRVLREVYHIDIQKRISALKRRLTSKGVCKSKVDKINGMDIIKQNPDIWSKCEEAVTYVRRKFSEAYGKQMSVA